MNAHERALAYVLEALCAVCAVVAALATAQGSEWWAFVFVGCAVACYEAGGL